MEPIGEVLDQGRERESRRSTTAVTASIGAALGLAIVVAGINWWAGRPPASDRLEVVGAIIIGETAVTVVAEPPIGALATPAGASLPGVALRLTVGGDPGERKEVVPARTDSLVYVEQRPAVTVDPGQFTEIDVTLAPVDCSLAGEGTDLDEAGYRWRRPFGVELLNTGDGAPVPSSEATRMALADALSLACGGSGPAPELTVVAARRGGEPPLETIGLTVDVSADAERLVLTPLDGPGLRGLGAADRRSGRGIPLLWLVSPHAEHNEEVTTAYTQVFVIRDGTAYPWIVATMITDDLPQMTPLTNAIR